MTKHMSRILFFAVFALLALSSQDAAAQQKLSGVITNTYTSFENFPLILSVISYLSGLLLVTIGIFKFKDHVDNPAQNALSAGVKRFLAGGMFLSLPMMYEATRGTLFGSAAMGSGEIRNTGRTSASLTPGGLDEMVVKLMTDIGGPIETLLVSFTYISAIALLLIGISRLTKKMEEGPRGPAGMGTLMTFLASGALFSFGDMMGSFSTSLFGNSTIKTVAQIDPNGTLGLSSVDADKIAAVMEAVMAFVMIVGFIAFIRGWFVLKAFADGQQGATLAQGLTFLFGGALAINLSELVNALQATVGVTGITFM
jgi:hypothetical protein